MKFICNDINFDNDDDYNDKIKKINEEEISI